MTLKRWAGGQGDRHLLRATSHTQVCPEQDPNSCPGKCLPLSLLRAYPFSGQRKFWDFRLHHPNSNFVLLKQGPPPSHSLGFENCPEPVHLPGKVASSLALCLLGPGSTLPTCSSYPPGL